MPETIYEDALPRLANGIRHCAKIVARTLGPKSSNVLIQKKLQPGHILTNDGATIIDAMTLGDPIEAMGLNFLKEAAARSNNNSGDGSTTTAILLDAILQEGLKTKASPLEIKESLDGCLQLIESSISAQTKTITIEDIPSVAYIAGENKELAQTLGEIYREIGADGIVYLEGSGSYKTDYTLINGVRFTDTGYLSPYLATEKGKAIYEKPQILVTKRKIEQIKEIEPIIGTLIAKGEKTLVIFTDDMDSNVARALIELQKTEGRRINILIIKAPTLWKNYVFEDFAKVTGSTIIEDSSGTNFKNFKLDYLGTCDTLICDKNETTVIGLNITMGPNSALEEHLETIKADETISDTDKKWRISYLATKSAKLRLGAKSETELSYLRLKAEDAVHSCRTALKSGVVPGGGLALFNAAKVMTDTVGGNLLKIALCSPFNQLLVNSGKDLGTFTGTQISSIGGVIGYDAKNGEIVDMFEAGIVDSAAVVLQSVRNSLGIASTLLTASSVILLPQEREEQSQFPFA